MNKPAPTLSPSNTSPANARRDGVLVLSLMLLLASCGCKQKAGGGDSKPGAAAVAEAPASSEIKVGQTMPYSGPASAYATIGKVEAAYFKKVNDKGGVNGHKIRFVSVDDGHSPPTAVEQVRKLVEQDEVLLIFQPLGIAPNAAIQGYLNARKVPQRRSRPKRKSAPARNPTTQVGPSRKPRAKAYALGGQRVASSSAD